MIAISNAKSNSQASTYGDDILHYATQASELKAGNVYLAHTHGERFEKLLPLLVGDDVKVRAVMLKDWRETSAGETFTSEFEDLTNEEKRTPAQTTRLNVMRAQLKHMNINMIRAVETYRGIKILRSLGRKVTTEEVTTMDGDETNVFACYVIYKNPALPENEQEQDRVEFDSAKLQRVNKIKAEITADMSTLALRKKCRSKKRQHLTMQSSPMATRYPRR